MSKPTPELFKLPVLLLLLLPLGLATPVGAASAPALHIPAQSTPATYYVRPDGGSDGECTGLVNAPYPGSGIAQPCAWDHPFRALAPGGPPRISGGDTLIIASGSYAMGLGAPGDDACDRESPWDCHVPPVPGGPDPAHPTRILGEGWDTQCLHPPELWGRERPWVILNLHGADNVEITCLEITDHSPCVEFHTGGLHCERINSPYGDWASIGLYAQDSANVHLRDLNIHGLAETGIRAGRITDWAVEDVRIATNGWAGWDGDIDGDDSNSGTLHFQRWTVEWNGCGETYPGGQPTGCWAQTAGGYGDGVGTGATGGDWIIEDSHFLHNTSDGLDLLYHSLGGRILLNRVRAEGNAGNQVKITGQATITNSVLVGNCAYFEAQSFTYDVDPCRAYGNTLEVIYTGGEEVSIVNSTFYGQGDGLVGAGPREGFHCTGTETLRGWNSVFLGDSDFFDPGDVTFLFYQEDCAGLMFEVDHSIAYNVKNTAAPWVNPPFPSPHNLLQDPRLIGPLAGNVYGMAPASDSPVIDAGDNSVCPPTDIRGRARPADGDGDATAICDMGAHEWPELVAALYLPLILKEWPASQPPAPPQVAGCAVFPIDNVWNARVDGLPLDPNSEAYVATIGAGAHLHADFGSGEWPPGSGSPIGIPYVDVPGTQPLVDVTFHYDDESDPGPYPVPAGAPIEGGPDSDGDRHVLVLDRDRCILYELFYAFPQPGGGWQAGSGAIFDLGSNALRPAGWTSADAAGLPILPGLVRYDEVAEGEIRHALRFTAPQARRAYHWPARHYASDLTSPQVPPMGQRFRLRDDVDTSGFSPEVQVILRALKERGLMLADNGSSWFISGVPDDRWDNDVLHELQQVRGSDFEAVEASVLMVDPDSGQARSP